MRLKIQFKNLASEENSSFILTITPSISTFYDLHQFLLDKFSLQNKRLQFKLQEDFNILLSDQIQDLILNEDQDILTVEILDSLKRTNQELLKEFNEDGEIIRKQVKKCDFCEFLEKCIKIKKIMNTVNEPEFFDEELPFKPLLKPAYSQILSKDPQISHHSLQIHDKVPQVFKKEVSDKKPFKVSSKEPTNKISHKDSMKTLNNEKKTSNISLVNIPIKAKPSELKVLTKKHSSSESAESEELTPKKQPIISLEKPLVLKKAGDQAQSFNILVTMNKFS